MNRSVVIIIIIYYIVKNYKYNMSIEYIQLLTTNQMIEEMNND